MAYNPNDSERLLHLWFLFSRPVRHNKTRKKERVGNWDEDWIIRNKKVREHVCGRKQYPHPPPNSHSKGGVLSFPLSGRHLAEDSRAPQKVNDCVKVKTGSWLLLRKWVASLVCTPSPRQTNSPAAENTKTIFSSVVLNHPCDYYPHRSLSTLKNFSLWALEINFGCDSGIVRCTFNIMTGTCEK